MTNRAEIAEFLRRAELFRGLAAGARDRLAGVCRWRELRRRETLFHEQDRGEAVYALAAGRIRLHKTAADGAQTVIRTVRPGETFGEVVLFEQDRYPVTAVALSAARVLAVPRFDLLRLLDYSDFRRDFIAMLLRRQRYLADRIRSLLSLDVEQRFFLFVREQFGAAAELELTIPKQEIAAAIGATPETFSRLLRRLRQEHKIGLRGRRLSVAPRVWRELDV